MLNNELKKLKLGKAAKVISGYAFKSIDFHNDENHIPVVKINNIKNEYVDINGCNLVSNDFKTKLNSKYILKKGDLLISLTGSHLSQPNSVVGRVAKYRLDEIALLNQRAGKIIIKDDAKLDKEYLYYYLSSNTLRVEIALKATGAASQANISPSDVESLVMLLPTLPQQKKIANILYSYDKLIQNNTKRISILEQMAEQLYKEWFVRMRFPNYENTKFVKGIPEEWAVVCVKSFGGVVTGKTPSTTIQDYYDGDYPFIKTPDMHNFMFALETGETLSQRGFNSQPSQKLPSGSICVSCIGSAGVVCITNEVSMSNQQIHSLIPKKKEQLEFLYYTLLKLKPTIELFGATGATMTNLSKGKFEKLLILKPTDVLIENYHDATKSIFEEIKNLSLQNINLKKTRDLLLPRLISGKLKLNKKL
jgi:type I restriction enzyme S subunit